MYNFFMKVPSINLPSFGHGQNKKFNYVKYTGYGAVASGVACALTAKKYKVHKKLALLTGLLTLAHIALIESHRFLKH